mmetsp:Transcript_60874/g.188483  ORF Transcript_60874/g.188483 Transcript_60874/m.188483 type:complete len:256 (+) Transcript_60874:1815-2582(+)
MYDIPHPWLQQWRVPSSRCPRRCRSSRTRFAPRAPASASRGAGGRRRAASRGRRSRRRPRRGGSAASGCRRGRSGGPGPPRATAPATTVRPLRTTSGRTCGPGTRPGRAAGAASGLGGRSRLGLRGATAGGTSAGTRPAMGRLPPERGRARSRSLGGATLRGGQRSQQTSTTGRGGRRRAGRTAAGPGVGEEMAAERKRRPTTPAQGRSGPHGLSPMWRRATSLPEGRFSCGVSPAPTSSQQAHDQRWGILVRPR